MYDLADLASDLAEMLTRAFYSMLEDVMKLKSIRNKISFFVLLSPGRFSTQPMNTERSRSERCIPLEDTRGGKCCFFP